jgi:hypothetical protein
VSGVFFDKQTPEALNQALENLDGLKINPADCKRQAEKFSKEKFKRELLNKVQGLCLPKT